MCCLAEPCPVGIWVSRRRHGACRALVWQADTRQYRCGVLLSPSAQLLGRHWPVLEAPLRRWATRLVAANIGCDADLETQAP